MTRFAIAGAEIFDGTKPGTITRAFAGEDVGTIIYKD